VTKQVISPSTQKVRYWEHQSFSFMFERFGDTWVLQILPGYVFTRDGYKDLLAGDRVNVLSTKRESRDYNYKVHTDLFFWTWVMAVGEQGMFALRLGPRPEVQKRTGGKRTAKTRWQGKNDAASRGRGGGADGPQILIKASLPTLATYNLELADEEDESLMDKRRRAELEDLEDELAVLAGMREDVADDSEE
jgi:hypothetical protein